MIISLSGPMSTGKTTTIKEILKRNKIGKFEKIVVINENIRDMFKEKFLTKYSSMENMMSNKEGILEWVKSVGEYESKFINEEIHKNNDSDTLIILDRCILDHFIYSLMHTIKYNLSYEEFFEFINEYWFGNYKIDKIFLTTIPKNDTYEIDGIRPTTWKDTRNIENTLFKIMFKNQAIELPYDINERIDIIESNLNI